MFQFFDLLRGVLASLVFGNLAILFFSFLTESQVKIRGRKVDLSYGVYLYGWPIQQLLLFYFYGWMSPIVLFATAMPIACVAAWTSWRFIEAPCLRFVRRRRFRGPDSFAGRPAESVEARREAAVAG